MVRPARRADYVSARLTSSCGSSRSKGTSFRRDSLYGFTGSADERLSSF
jgi:hypothetical protein